MNNKLVSFNDIPPNKEAYVFLIEALKECMNSETITVNFKSTK